MLLSAGKSKLSLRLAGKIFYLSFLNLQMGLSYQFRQRAAFDLTTN
jgi:hypothetical protein